MQKIACIFSYKESNWVSCQKIVFNLHKSYQACAGSEIQNFNLPHVAITTNELNELAKSIVDYGPDVISIMDHKPHPLQLIQTLSPLYQNKKKPKIIFHIFGDFSINYNNWEKLGPLLEGFTVEFLVASDRQKILVDKMLLNNKTIVCPFPVDHNEFFPDQELRKKQRKEWNVSEKDVVFIFTGRLSRQKRIKTLITSFGSEFKDDPNTHLYFYGSQDNIGDPFLGIVDLEGEYFRIFYNAYKALDPEIQKRIHFMGSVPNADLLKVYQGADVFMNLSVHNDEDYGMSVAEAQFVGLPVGLTDWGGLASFHHHELPQATSFIPVKIGKTTKRISIVAVKKALRTFMKNPQHKIRPEISQAAKKKFGVEKVTKILHEVLVKQSPAFEGYTPLFYRASIANQIANTDPMYVTSTFTLNQLYRDIYSSYVRNN
jgi:glycosyltransferase involved in cell wall biosynthesis